jgi:predicted nucleotidyltransferase component of viral defense system
MREPVHNLGASVRARLLNLAKQRQQPHELLLTRYVLERLLYRLSITKHREHFVLKGAMLMTVWFDDPFRPTRDLDLLGFGDSDPQAMLATFREICAVEIDDGVVFDVAGLQIDFIREELEYGGLRIRTHATIGGARVRVVVDVGFGDAVEPGIADLELLVLLDLPAPRLRAYPRETVIAEKFHAMVTFGRANSRMKDFYDIWILARAYGFDGDGLARAIAATFGRRNTPVPVDPPPGLTSDFADDPAKQQQWRAFAENVEAELPPLADVIDDLAKFLMPHAAKARSRTTE